MKRLLLLPLVAATVAHADTPRTEFHAGTTITRGNSETIVSNAGAEHEVTLDIHSWEFDLEGNYGQSTSDKEGTKTTVQNAKFIGSYEQAWTESLYGLASAQAFHDDLAKLNHRFTAGPGLGMHLIQREEEKLEVETGIVWVHESYRGPPPPKSHGNFVALRIGQEYRRTFGDRGSVWQSLEVLPTIDDAELVLATFELGAQAKLNGKLSLRVVLQDRYNSNPAEGIEENDLSIIAGFGYTL